MSPSSLGATTAGRYFWCADGGVGLGGLGGFGVC